ncbi:TGF-beta receptor type-2-like [Watersipora subatra]|uniref:TGF-beta receptor type-2-like n=1 Tax=Watersipora subatra TaxID=2589382 RepID=UPI00355C7C90
MFINRSQKSVRSVNFYLLVLTASSLVIFVTSFPTGIDDGGSLPSNQTTEYILLKNDELFTDLPDNQTNSTDPSAKPIEQTIAFSKQSPTAASNTSTNKMSEMSLSTSPAEMQTKYTYSVQSSPAGLPDKPLTVMSRLTTASRRIPTTSRTTPTTVTTTSKVEPDNLCYSYSHYNCVDEANRRKVSLEFEPLCYPVPVRCPRESYCIMTFTMVITREDSWKHPDWQGGLFESGCNQYPSRGTFQELNIGLCRYVTEAQYSSTNLKSKGLYKYNTCICSGNLCNEYIGKDKMVFKPSPDTVVQMYNGEDDDVNKKQNATECASVLVGHNNWKNPFIAALVVATVCGVIILLMLACCICKMCRVTNLSRLGSTSSSSSSNENSLDNEKGFDLSSDLSDLIPLNKGRFGKVFRLHEKVKPDAKELAVKMYERDDMHFWSNEVTIYESSGVAHENIMQYFGSTQRGLQYYLFLEFYSNGSLLDYLTEHTLMWKEMITIMHTMARGIAHLHCIMMLPGHRAVKQPIAHRDIKSSNVMLDERLRAKIGDFNLAQTLETCRLSDKDGRQRVGTVRYMAPEVLSGQANNRREAVLQSDVYSMALVLWEIFSRCKISDAGVENYRPPYYEFVGDQPTHDSMTQVVCTNNSRPTFNGNLTDPNVKEIVSTIEDGWDKDGDERLTAMCIELRLEKFLHHHEKQGKVNSSYM